MPRAKPKTKAGKQKKVEKVMAEYKAGTLHSGSGARVQARDQALAIAMAESGQSRSKPAKAKRKRTARNS